MPVDERALVQRARDGDRQAFGQIYQRHVDRVYSYILFRVRDKGLAEDLTQDVFMQAIRGLESFRWQGALAPWLLRIARNGVIDHWRRQGRRPERTLSAVEAGEDGDGDEPNRIERVADEAAEAGLEHAELVLDRAKVASAMDKLTELQQQVLALRFSAGLSIRETAEAMAKSEGAIKNLQHHAVRALRKQLERAEEEAGATASSTEAAS